MKRNNKRYNVKFRRRLEGRTNYKKRLKLLVSEMPRLVVRKFGNNIIASITEYGSKGDKVIASADSISLRKMGWNYNSGNVPSAYLTGLLAGKKAKEKGINDLILDIGMASSVKGSRIYALLAGVVDSGINIPHDPKILPAKDRITGSHITDYASKIKSSKEEYDKVFGSYHKKNIDPMAISKSFEDFRKKLIGG